MAVQRHNFIIVHLLVHNPSMARALQHASMPWTTRPCCAIWNFATRFIFHVQTFYSGKPYGHARLGGDSRADMVHLQSQLAEKQVKECSQTKQLGVLQTPACPDLA